MTEDNNALTVSDKVKIGYQTAITSISNEGQEIWRSFPTLMTANTVLITLTGVGLTHYPNLAVYIRLFPCAGLLVCICWFFVMIRQFSYYKFWQSWARYYENAYLKPEVSIKICGRIYGKGRTLPQDPYRPNDLPKFNRIAAFLRIEYIMLSIIFIFAVIWILLIYFSFCLTVFSIPLYLI